MNELGNKYPLAAIRHKRATLAGELATLEKQAAWKRQQLVHVHATLALFSFSTSWTVPRAQIVGAKKRT